MTPAPMIEGALQPARTAASVTPYGPPRHGAPIVLDLASTVMAGGAGAACLAPEAMAFGGELPGYPDATSLSARLATDAGVTPDRVLVTAGADEALERTFRAMLAPGDAVVLTAPTFEMLPRYARLIGAEIIEVPWPSGELPVEQIVAAVTARTRLIVIVSPNNPTGAVATATELLAISAAAPKALLVVDLAYVEFADCDPTRTLLQAPGVVVTRTFSKAWGLPGIRVGWAAGPPEVIEWMRRVGNPYSVSAPSLALAEAALTAGAATRRKTIATARASRDRLIALLRELRLDPLPSEANFVCVQPPHSAWLRDALAGFGVAVRLLPGSDRDRVRITCPGSEADWQRLEAALRAALTPEALVFDMDGVLADVSRSYRQAIIATAAGYGIDLTADDIAAAKRAGNANDDWQLTTDLLRSRGVAAELERVKARFETLYQGSADCPGLRESESLLLPVADLRALAQRFRLGIATGRPRADAVRFLERFELTDLFACCVTRDDGAIKPDPFPVAEAMRRLRTSRAWMIGDTPDDIRAARAAGALPVGVLPPESGDAALDASLIAAGAAWVLPSMHTLQEILP